MTITNSGQLILIDGVPCRLWEGTFGGVPVHVFVHRIAVPNEADQAAFRDAMLETRQPDLLFAPGDERLLARQTPTAERSSQ